MNKTYIKTIVLVFVATIALARADTLTLTDNSPYSPIADFSEVYITTENRIVESVRKNARWQVMKAAYMPPKNHILWIRLCLKNQLDTVKRYYIRNPDNEITEYFIFRNGQLSSYFRNGEFVSTWNMDKNEVLGVNTFTIASGETIELYIKVSNHEGLLPLFRLFPQKTLKTKYAILTEKRYERWLNEYYAHNLEELQVRTFYQGGLGIMLAITLLIFYRNRHEKIYRYYMLYVLSAFGFTLFKSRSFTYIGEFLGYFPVVKFYASETIMWLGFSVYLFFVAELLDLRKNHPVFLKFIHRTARLFIVYSVSVFVWLMVTNDSGLQLWLFNTSRIPVFLLYIGILIFIAREIPSSMVKYVVVSNVLLIVFSMLAWLKAGFLNQQHWYGVLNHLFTLPLAILLEIIVFALAIAKKIEEERNSKSELQKKTVEVEMMALRSQMNPHFLFNSLNSIRYMVMVNQNEQATDYLSKFSKLLRTILNHSQKDVIRLSEELATLKLYLDIEKRRFGDNFSYGIMIDEQIEAEALLIPPMLLQPFVENAIWHGLMPSAKTDKRIEVFIKKINDSLVEFLIKDNGVGRKKADELKEKSMKSHQSKGTEITNQRVELFNRSYTNKINIVINDLFEENAPVGTMVRVLYEL